MVLTPSVPRWWRPAQEALDDVEVAILSIPLNALHGIKDMVAALPEDVAVIDTSNYYPHRDGNIAAIDAGQVEGEWVGELFSRPVVKAWNAIFTDSLIAKSRDKGHPERLAVPVAGDPQHHRDIAIALVEDTGFDGFDAGTLGESWRQQPGAPVYCTDLTRDEMGPALASTERKRLTRRRDLMVQALQERFFEAKTDIGGDYIVRLNRALYL